MAEAPTIVLIGASEGSPRWLEGSRPSSTAPGELPGSTSWAKEGDILAGGVELRRLLLAVLDDTVADARAVREALLRAAPLAVVVSSAAQSPDGSVPAVDEGALRLLVSLAKAASVQALAADAALGSVGTGYVLLEGERPVAAGGASGLGLARSGAPVGALDDDVFEDASTPARRLRLAGADGERVIDRRLAPFPGKSDKTVIVHADVTGRADLEARFLAGGRAQAASQLARGVVHDLNNAFCVISSFTDLLQESFDGDDMRLEDVREISRAGNKAAALTSKLVGFTRGGPARTENVNLADSARRAEPLFRRILGEQTELALELVSPDATAHCDPLELESVLVGLVARAGRRLGDHEGVVTVAVTELPPSVGVQVSATATAEVADLAPPSCGSVEVDAAAAFAGKYGGSFADEVLRLPRAQRRAPAQRIPRAKTTERGPETVLVLEDEASVRLAVKRVLTSFGYRVLEARRGEDARALVAGCDVVIADLVLPGEQGLDVLRAFRAERPHLPAIVLTGYVEETASSIEGFTVIHKPFDAPELARRVRQALDGGR